MRISEKEFKELIEKTAIKASKEKKMAERFTDSVTETPLKKKNSFSYTDIIKSIKEAKIIHHYDKEERSFSFLLENVRLVTLNEILAHLQRTGLRNALFKYKKTIHDKIEHFYQHLPISEQVKFKGKVEITLFRSGARFIDADSMPASFKYYIHGLRNCGLIEDDNPDFVKEIKIIQTKSKIKSCGVKIRLLEDNENKKEKEPEIDIKYFWKLN